MATVDYHIVDKEQTILFDSTLTRVESISVVPGTESLQITLNDDGGRHFTFYITAKALANLFFRCGYA